MSVGESEVSLQPGAASASGPADTGTEDRFDPRLRSWGLIVLSSSAIFLLVHALAPTEEFIHRGDDAFYYFKVALNHPRSGFWTFDGIHDTNGVQPLWAILLTIAAYPLHWMGLSDPSAARVFVALAAAFHFTAGLLLYRLLARTVSVGTGLIAAGGWLFPLALVWSHVWGMENALYATLLLASVSFYHFRFRLDQRATTALVLGLLLGATALSRLNSGLLFGFMGIAYLVSGPRAELKRRLRLGLMVGGGTALLILPYVAWNIAQTGQILPISGSVKTVRTARWLAEKGVEQGLTHDYLSAVFWDWRIRIRWFLTSRSLDGLWALGARIPFRDTVTSPASGMMVLGILGGLAVAPLALGRPREWVSHIVDRLGKLGRFWYVAAFGVANAALSILVYPAETYAIIRWWLTECELIILVVVATIVGATVSYVGGRVLAPRLRRTVAVAALGFLAMYHGVETIRFLWDGERTVYDWKQSWNEHPYAAALWINENLPEDAVIGSWNAGVLGFYSNRPVVNLDGLINNEELLPFIESRAVEEYIRQEGIGYLSDLQRKLEGEGIMDELELRPVYTSCTDWGALYRVYEVLP